MDDTEETIYEQMSRLIYAYQLGHIDYLELLQRLEELFEALEPNTTTTLETYVL